MAKGMIKSPVGLNFNDLNKIKTINKTSLSKARMDVIYR
ncbi:hypothetical protein AAKU64_001488 [Undibacterium sp. GrIS 1.8]